jgi:hypothetical protein
MLFRILLAAVLALACGPALAAVAKVRPAPIKMPESPMQFYVVKGASDACGRGCDSWIAIEGKIDSGAAARFKKFLARVHGRNMPFYILGATTREIAADAALAVHSARVTVSFRGPGVPPAEMVATANAHAHERSDRMIAAYLTKMGADTALLALVKTVKFEQMHILTREEIVRFGIDRREFVETPWTFEPGTRAMVHKVALLRSDGEQTFRTLQWRVICLDSERFELDFLRPATPNPVLSSISVSSGSAPFFLFYSQSKPSELELWGARMPRVSVQSLSDASQSEFTETLSTTDGHKSLLTQKLSNEAFADALKKLVAMCPAPKAPQRQTVEVRDQAAK